MSHQDEQIDPLDRTQLTSGGKPVVGEFAPGDIVGGTYQVVSFIGAGGMGNVYRVRHTIMDTEYALKTLSAEKVTEVAWRRFQNEAQAIARMNHPNVVAIYNLGFHEGRLPYYVMDLLEGTTLSDMLQEKGRLEISEALSIFVEVCAGIGYAHKKGIVHRDIKPPNIVITDKPDATGARVKIVDFGIAKLSQTNPLANQQLTKVGEVCGSPYYMSPEQSEAGKIDARSDIYSLGCTLFEALTGSQPIKGRNAMETMLLHHTGTPPTLQAATGGLEFPELLEQAIAKTLAKAPMDRYQSMDRLAQDLIAVLQGKPASINPYAGRQQKPADQGALLAQAKTGEEEPAAAAAKSGSYFNKVTLAASLMTALLLASAGILWKEIKPKPGGAAQGHTANTDTTAGAAATAEGAKTSAPAPSPATANNGPFSSIITEADGQKYILFKFPPGDGIGAIRIGGFEDMKHAKSCHDDVKIPYGHKLRFLPDPICFTKTEYLDKFRPGDFDGLTIDCMDTGTETLCNETLAHITHLTGLKALKICSTESLDDGAMYYIDKLPNLQDLDIQYTKITAARLSRSPFLKQLKDLKIQTKDSVTPLLEALKGSTALKHLLIRESPLRHSDYHLIGTLTNLKQLELPHGDCTNEDLAAISNLDKLVDADLSWGRLDQASVPTLKKMHAHGLKTIKVLSDRTPEENAHMNNQIPGLYFR